MKPSHTIRPDFDDPNLVSATGLVPALRLAESAGFYDRLDDLTVPSSNASAKAASVVGGMLAGADSIDDLDLLRHGGMSRLFAGVRAPSTLGTFLRSHPRACAAARQDRRKDHAVAVTASTATRSPGAVHHSAGRYSLRSRPIWERWARYQLKHQVSLIGPPTAASDDAASPSSQVPRAGDRNVGLTS